MTEYTISAEGHNGGDYWEKMFWPFLKDQFPNYETFWQEFIIPLTNRPQNIQIRDDIHPLLEEMAMAHYSTFCHVGTTFWLINLNNDTPKHISDTKRQPRLYSEMFFRLSSATEMIDRLIFVVWKIGVELALFPNIEPITDHENRIKNYVEDGAYTKDLNRFKRKGQSVNMTFHTIRDIVPSLSLIVTNNEDWTNCYSKFNTLSNQEIRRYRNTLAHNPIQGTKELNRDKLLPKKEKLSDYALWSNVFKGDEADFVNVDQLIEDLTNQLADTANGLWEHLIQMMSVMAKVSKYKEFLETSGSKGFSIRQSNVTSASTLTVSSSEQIIGLPQPTQIISGTDIKSTTENNVDGD